MIRTTWSSEQYIIFFFVIAMFVWLFKSCIHFCLKLDSDLKLIVSKANWKSCWLYFSPSFQKPSIITDIQST